VTPLLALFDVDGTLFLTHDPVAGVALRETLTDRYGVSLPDNAIEQVDHQGQTSLRIGRLVLARAEIAEPDHLTDWCREFAERYLELLVDADTSDWRAAPEAEPALERLTVAGVRLALLTGNPEPMAKARMDRLGLARFFPPGQGAFGCESESRTDLIALARRRGGNWSAQATVEIGDTERDAATSAEAGIRSIVVGDEGLTIDAIQQLLSSA
jgi:phosphoglycolate phosphatase-like HAD superfamily hydrolase